jgi:hypothetical protein
MMEHQRKYYFEELELWLLRYVEFRWRSWDSAALTSGIARGITTRGTKRKLISGREMII